MRVNKKKDGKKSHLDSIKSRPTRTKYEDEEDLFERQQNHLAFGSDGDDDEYHVSNPLDKFEEEVIMDLPSSNEDDGEGDEDEEEYPGYQQESEGEMDNEDILKSASEQDTEKEDNDHNRKWGRKRKSYYDADKGTDDLAEEAAEAAKLQRKKLSTLKKEDLLLDSDSRNFYWPTASVIEFKPSFKDNAGSEVDDLTLAQELQDHLRELKQILGPLVINDKKENDDFTEGLEYLSAKYSLLGNYCALVLKYLQHKATQQSIPRNLRDDLVRHRLSIEKLKPIELRLQHQIDSLMQASNESSKSAQSLCTGMGTFDDDDVVDYDDSENFKTGYSTSEDGSLYEAQKIDPIGFDDNPRIRKEGKRNKKVSFDLGSEAEESEERNLSVNGNAADIGGIRTLKSVLQERSSSKEDNFVRFNFKKKDYVQLKLKQKFHEFDDIESFVSNSGDKSLSVKSSTSFSLPSNNIPNEELSSDDFEDRPTANKSNKLIKKQERRQQKLADRKQNILYRPIEDLPIGADRPATKRILENKGLIVRRNRDLKNPRVKQRRKFERAIKRLPSQHAVSSKAKPVHYGGESTGIRTDLTRSVKF